MKTRANVRFSGRVQGVFFRVNTQKFAIEAGGIYGYVRNMPDGAVEAVFEGDKTKILKVIDRCVHRQPYAKVKNHEIIWEEYSGEYSNFKITHGGY